MASDEDRQWREIMKVPKVDPVEPDGRRETMRY